MPNGFSGCFSLAFHIKMLNRTDSDGVDKLFGPSVHLSGHESSEAKWKRLLELAEFESVRRT